MASKIKKRIGSQIPPNSTKIDFRIDNDIFVSKLEFEKVLKEIEILKEEVKKLKKNSFKGKEK